MSWVKKVGLALGMACLTGLMAQARIPLPHTPVPITGQVFAVLLCGALLGSGWGALSQLFYVGLGATGIHWFSGFAGGRLVMLGASGGYLLGFIPAAMLVGFVTKRFVFMRRPLPLFALMMVAVCVIYMAGAVQYSIVRHAGPLATLREAVLPFILGDTTKAMLAAAIGTALLPKASRGEESDGG